MRFKHAGLTIGAAFAALLLLNGCAGTTLHVESDPPNAAHTASALLKTIELPPGAKALATSPNPQLDKPWSSQACTPISDRSEWASVPGMSPSQVQLWLKTNRPSALTISGSGSSEKAGVVTSLMLSGDWAGSYPRLMYPPVTVESVVAAASGSAIRVDVLAIPQGAACSSTGVATSP